MAGVTLMHVLVLFKEKQQHGKSNPYTLDTTKVIGFGKKEKKREKEKQLLWGGSGRGHLSLTACKAFSCGGSCKRRAFVGQNDGKDWKPSINVYTRWTSGDEWRRKQQNAFGFFSPPTFPLFSI